MAFWNDLPTWAPWVLIGAGGALLFGAVAGTMVAVGRRRKALAKPGGVQGVDDARLLLVEVKDTARGVTVELDRRLEELERLVQHADRRIAELRRLTSEAPSPRPPRDLGSTYGAPGTNGYGPGAGPAGFGGNGTGGGMGTGGALNGGGGGGGGGGGPVDTFARDPITGEICRLADLGMSAVQIARELNQQVGTVELVLALRR